MKVKMREHYQDARQHLAPGQVVSVDEVLGRWLLDNRKAEAVQNEARHLDVEPQFEQAEEPPKPQVRNPKRARGAK